MDLLEPSCVGVSDVEVPGSEDLVAEVDASLGGELGVTLVVSTSQSMEREGEIMNGGEHGREEGREGDCGWRGVGGGRGTHAHENRNERRGKTR